MRGTRLRRLVKIETKDVNPCRNSIIRECGTGDHFFTLPTFGIFGLVLNFFVKLTGCSAKLLRLKLKMVHCKISSAVCHELASSTEMLLK